MNRKTALRALGLFIGGFIVNANGTEDKFRILEPVKPTNWIFSLDQVKKFKIQFKGEEIEIDPKEIFDALKRESKTGQ